MLQHTQHTRRFHRFVGIACAILLFASARATFAVGVTPLQIIIPNVTSGSTVETELYISRGNASKEQVAYVTLSGEAASYIQTPQGNMLQLPVDEHNTAYRLIVNSGALAEGTYTARITVAVGDPKTTESGVQEGFVSAGTRVMTGAEASITFTVTNESVESYSIDAVEMQSSEENQPIGFIYRMNNVGNVDARPDRITFSAVDETDDTNRYEGEIAREDIPLVPAFTEKTVAVLTDANLPTGFYKTVVTFYDKEGEVVYTTDTNRLQIFPAGTLAQDGELTEFSGDKTTYRSGEVVGFTGTFDNTGTVGLKAAFVVEIFLNDVRVEVLKKEPVFVPPGKTATFTQEYKPTEGGSYRAVGSVEYGISTTEKKEVNFDVQTVSMLAVGIFLGVVTVLIAAALYLFERRHARKKAIESVE